MEIDVGPKSVSQRDVDQIWDCFSNKLEGVLRKSIKHANTKLQFAGNDVQPDKIRCNAPWQKNSSRITKTRVLRCSRTNPGMSLQERKLQRLVCLVAERLRLEKIQKKSPLKFPLQNGTPRPLYKRAILYASASAYGFFLHLTFPIMTLATSIL